MSAAGSRTPRLRIDLGDLGLAPNTTPAPVPRRLAGTSLAGGPRPRSRVGSPRCPGPEVALTATVVGSTLTVLGQVGLPPRSEAGLASALRSHGRPVDVDLISLPDLATWLGQRSAVGVRARRVEARAALARRDVRLLRALERSQDLDLAIDELVLPAGTARDVTLRKHGRRLEVRATLPDHALAPLLGLAGTHLRPVPGQGHELRLVEPGGRPGRGSSAVVRVLDGALVVGPSGPLHQLVSAPVFVDPSLTVTRLHSAVTADGQVRIVLEARAH